ncbi:MAG: 5'-nucleotidase C-terminal domain-containing protein [Bacteroidetes bacterium]|nr:5'-nucleotidase C-terminal domain-containing protein [Bacteroidota bacterium]
MNVIKFSTRFIFALSLLYLFCSCRQFALQQVEGESIAIIHPGEEDNHIAEMIKPYRDSLSVTMGEIIGVSAMEMKKGFPEGLLGNFVANLMLEMTNNQMADKVDFAFTNNGGLRSVLPQGNVSLRNIYELMPFENEIIILNMDYGQLQQLFEYIGTGQELAVSGIRLEFKNDQIITATINDMRIDPGKTYRVATIDYLANGGSGMSFLENVVKRELIGIRLRDMIIDYIKLKQSMKELISAKLDERIKINE